MSKRYFWVHFKECGHGDPWPCKDLLFSCGKDGWTIATKDESGWYSVVGSDNIFNADEIDRVVRLTEKHP